MNVMPVAAFLKDFSEHVPAAVSAEDQAEITAQALDAARAEGQQAGYEQAQAEAEARLAEREAEFAAQLTAQREAWCCAESKVLADAIRSGLEALHDEVVASIAQTLQPFLTEQVRQKALGELALAIGALLSKEPEIGLEIIGPPDLVKSLELKLSDHAGAVSFSRAGFCEVEVKAGHALLSTRIGAWLDKINEAST